MKYMMNIGDIVKYIYIFEIMCLIKSINIDVYKNVFC